MKNITQRQIALYAGLATSFSLVVLLVFTKYFIVSEIPWWLVAASFLVSFAACYGVVYYVVEIFIYRKIKIIYKLITDGKMTSQDIKQRYDTSDNVLEDVQNKVQAFTQSKQDEIAELKSQETYRREFLGNVSHELKTPLFNIQGYIETLLGGAIDNPKYNKNFLIKASKNTDRLIRIVDDLLLISQYESSKLELDAIDFDVQKLVLEVFEALEMQADVNEIELGFKNQVDTGFKVEADRMLVSQVLYNLVHNSIKYGKEGGKTNIGIYDVDKKVMIEVSDNGFGIEKEHLPRLFERFYRVDKHRSREEGGTGLGLAIVKHILEAHGQNINVTSTLDKGTTFTFTLKKA